MYRRKRGLWQELPALELEGEAVETYRALSLILSLGGPIPRRQAGHPVGSKATVYGLAPPFFETDAVLFLATFSVPPSLSPFSVCIFKVSFGILEEISQVKLQLLCEVQKIRSLSITCRHLHMLRTVQVKHSGRKGAKVLYMPYLGEREFLLRLT